MTSEITLRQRIEDGEVLVALRGSLTTSKDQLSDIWSKGQYDYIWIDGQHSPFSEDQLVDYCRAAEELGIDITESCLAPLSFASHVYDDFHLLMPLYVCRTWKGTPRAREHAALTWVRPARLADYPMPPADAPLIAMLRDLL